jgi:hypothetical protein
MKAAKNIRLRWIRSNNKFPPEPGKNPTLGARRDGKSVWIMRWRTQRWGKARWFMEHTPMVYPPYWYMTVPSPPVETTQEKKNED